MKKHAGFTLIEILIVIVILTIVASMALLATGDFGRERRIRLAGEELQSLCTLLQTHAILTGSVYGIRFNPHQYQFYEFDTVKQNWRLMPANKLFVSKALPDGMNLVVKTPEHVETNQPTVTLLPGGELSPLELIIKNGASQVSVMQVNNDHFQLREGNG